MKLKEQVFLCLILFLLNGCSISNPPQQLPKVLNTKPYLENKEFKSVIPIDNLGNKILLTATVNGKPYRFILDTGSPTILTKKVANELDLAIKGEITSKDANGNLVKMNLSVLDRLTIGEVRFRNIPVFIFDPSHLALGKCFLDGGIIGSEIMPLSNWQINFSRRELVLANDNRQLEYINNAQKAKLKLFNYPFAPVLEYKINGEFIDNAMLDTGNTELLHLNKLAFEELIKRQLVNSATGKAFGAFGSFGESAGGRGKDMIFYLVPLKQLSIGEVRFQNIKVWTRTEVPSLIGAKVFESHVVTLDYANEVVYFYKYREPTTEKGTFGFRPYIKNRSTYVGFLRESSPAAEAGMRLHDQILKINDMDLRHIKNSEHCEILKKLLTIERKKKMEITYISDGLIKQAILQKK